MAEFLVSGITPTKDLIFTNCFEGLQCARLELPLDYWNGTHPDKTINLAVARLPAKVGFDDPRYGGAIVVNPGGPGGPGAQFVRGAGHLLQNVVDTAKNPSIRDPTAKYYDILSFDPRGVGASTPGGHCFRTEAARESFLLRNMEEGVLGSSDAALGRKHSMNNALGLSCAASAEGNHDIKYFMSTASVARDMLELTERYGEWRNSELSNSIFKEEIETPNGIAFYCATFKSWNRQTQYDPSKEKIQYWGFSYGTFLGYTFASLYPDRVGRMILDGVVSGPDYAKTRWHDNMNDTEKTMQYFYDWCVASGSTDCPLANSTSTPHDIQTKVTSIVNHLYHNPLPIADPEPDVITFSDIRYLIFSALYFPQISFRFLAAALDAIGRDDGSVLAPFLAIAHTFRCAPPPSSNQTQSAPRDGEASLAIACGDGDDQAPFNNVDFLEQYWRELDAKSPTVGAVWANIRTTCAGWKIRPKYRFTGPFEGNTSHPILWIGNTADPVTPVGAAHRMARGFPGSAVLTQETAGHCSISGIVPCTIDAIRAYFHHGTLPETGTVCRAPDPEAAKAFSAEELRIHAAYREFGRVYAREDWALGKGFMSMRGKGLAKALWNR
ncbi:hypothetical protein H2199_001164 [Coniosporium tulheliwenetii]|uniref:Uncharacterized protein n=1 Tax=Coniosporium tulheliwenetii TaxID=3383036 RepID=A0ACC2ZLE7_9PEZI|nr:hypothetical protein H2199_001164 [Cladosporium sp. JES 115]